MASPFGFQFPDLKGLPASALLLEVGVKYHKMARIVKWRFDITPQIAWLASPCVWLVMLWYLFRHWRDGWRVMACCAEAREDFHQGGSMDIEGTTRRILYQRMQRYSDSGPDLGLAGTARFRAESGRLRVAFANLRPGMACEAADRVVRFARWQRLFEVQWVVVPQRPGEGELPGALRQAQFELNDDLLLMAHEGRIKARVNPAVVVVPITTFEAMWQYEYGSRQNFFDESEPIDVLVEQRARERWREQEHGWSRYYVAQLNGRFAGGCYVSLFEDVPTLLGVYTVSEARRNGVATAMLARTVGDIVHPGHETCCLFVKHGNPAEQLYRQLGFVPLVDEQTYVWHNW